MVNVILNYLLFLSNNHPEMYCSPGHCAKYGYYSFLDLEHNVIWGVELFQVCVCT